jgi:hypothetical protein
MIIQPDGVFINYRDIRPISGAVNQVPIHLVILVHDFINPGRTIDSAFCHHRVGCYLDPVLIQYDFPIILQFIDEGSVAPKKDGVIFPFLFQLIFGRTVNSGQPTAWTNGTTENNENNREKEENIKSLV